MFTKLKRFLSGGEETTGEYEEISEKRTTKLGYFLLIVMFFFLVGVGQTIFDDLTDLVEDPISPAACLSNLDTKSVSSYTRCDVGQYGESYDCGCRFGEIDTRYGLKAKFEAIKPTLIEITTVNEKIRGYQSQINTAERTVTSAERQYELGLQEKIADEEVLYDRTQQQVVISQQRSQIAVAQKQITNLTRQRDQLTQKISPQVQELENAYNEAYEHYRDQKAWYKFKVFGLMLLFVVPLFAFSTRWYLRAKRKDSPYTIIATSVMAATAILFLQVTLMFLYEILPMKWIERIIEWFYSIPLLRYIVYYAGVALVIAVFGGIVYFIQKRVFNPRRVAMRRLKQGECPRCSYKIRHTDRFCPSCSSQLRQACSHCGHDRSVHLTFCSYCGAREMSQDE